MLKSFTINTICMKKNWNGRDEEKNPLGEAT